MRIQGQINNIQGNQNLKGNVAKPRFGKIELTFHEPNRGGYDSIYMLNADQTPSLQRQIEVKLTDKDTTLSPFKDGKNQFTLGFLTSYTTTGKYCFKPHAQALWYGTSPGKSVTEFSAEDLQPLMNALVKRQMFHFGQYGRG